MKDVYLVFEGERLEAVDKLSAILRDGEPTGDIGHYCDITGKDAKSILEVIDWLMGLSKIPEWKPNAS